MALTCEQAEEILYLLEASNLLNERLAYKLELQLATEKPESYWRTTQGRKREELIGMLSTSPQAIFNDLPRFQELVNHIVTSQDLTNPASGRIGFELEFISGVPRDRTPKGFKLEVEGSYLEIKVEPLVESQQLKLSYFQRMYNLSLWLEEANAKPLSLHLHLDRKEHPHMPHFSIQSERYYGIDTARPKVHQYQTYEHRGLVVPINQLGNSIDPTALSEIIAMHAEQSKSESDLIGNEKLRFSTENISDIRDLIFGHILIATDNPEVRLAALSALKNPYSLRAFNMFSLMTTCDHQSLIDFAMQSSTDKLSELGFSTKQINQIQMLGLYLEGFNWEMMHSMFKHDSQSFQLFLESLSFPKDQRATNFIIGALEHTELLFKLNPEYTINSSERLLFRIAANNTDPEYIDFLSQLLITGNGIFRSILLNIFSYNQQESSCYLSICKKLLFATDIPDVVCGDVLSSSSSFENTSLLPILESFLTTTSKRSLRVQTVSNIAAFSTSPEAFLILMRFYNLPTTSVREKQNILITIRRKPFGNAAHVATFLKSEMSSDDPRLASTAMLILLETSLDTSQEYLDVAWNQFEGLRYNIVSVILNASSYHPD